MRTNVMTADIDGQSRDIAESRPQNPATIRPPSKLKAIIEKLIW